MGVNLRGLVEPKILKVEELQGRAVAFDGNNVLYQFLSSIRGADGQPLRDREGRITSHLSGLLYRNSNLLEKGVRVALSLIHIPSPRDLSTSRMPSSA